MIDSNQLGARAPKPASPPRNWARETDESLRIERKKTGAELAAAADSVESEADRLVRHAREQGD